MVLLQYNKQLTHHVWAYGSLLGVPPLAAIRKGGRSSLNPSGGSWELPVTNCTSLANSS